MKTFFRRSDILVATGFFLVFGLAVFLHFSTPAQAQTSTQLIPTRLNISTNRAVVVSFQGVPNAKYQIYYADSAGDTPATTDWKLAVDDLVAGSEVWTTWVDEGGLGRLHPSLVQERYYFVAKQATGEEQPQAGTPTPPSLGATTGLVVISNDRLAQLKEAYDSGRLIGALAQNDYAEVINILREYGVSEATLTAMSSRLGQTPPRGELADSFFKGMLMFAERNAAQLAEDQRKAKDWGYDRIFWLKNCPWQNLPLQAGDIGGFWSKPYEPDTIKLFKWFDENADQLHSLAVNLGQLHNEFPNVSPADMQMMIHGLYQLIKARSPDTFVWVTVWHGYDGTDTKFLEALPFRPDGLLIVNLHSFHSPFEATRDRYRAVLGKDTPLALLDFQGYWPFTEAGAPSPELGRLLAQHLPAFEQKLQRIGYSGLIINLYSINHLAEGQR